MLRVSLRPIARASFWHRRKRQWKAFFVYLLFLSPFLPRRRPKCDNRYRCTHQHSLFAPSGLRLHVASFSLANPTMDLSSNRASDFIDLSAYRVSIVWCKCNRAVVQPCKIEIVAMRGTSRTRVCVHGQIVKQLSMKSLKTCASKVPFDTKTQLRKSTGKDEELESKQCGKEERWKWDAA